jgi:ABC-2 type transport system ATP-binding protein
VYSIETRQITKAFQGQPVLRGVSLQIAPGEVYGLLGVNGAGKSTLMHILLGFLRQDQGARRVLGSADPEVVRSRIGYVPERQRYHLRVSAREYLRWLGSMNDLQGAELTEKVEAELRAFDLVDAADRVMATYSKGMLQRVGLAQAMLHAPELLLLDEPTSGLDANGQREVFDLLANLRSRGVTVLLTTHDLGEAEMVCDRVGILHKGTIALELETAWLRGPGRNVLITVGELSNEFALQLEQIAPAVRCVSTRVMLEPNTQELQNRVLRELLDAQVPIISVEPQSRPLQEIYRRVLRGEPVADLLPPAPLPPNGVFAPPDHPDALALAETEPALPSEPLPAPTDEETTTARKPGDTFLRRLLSADEKRATREIVIDDQAPSAEQTDQR